MQQNQNRQLKTLSNVHKRVLKAKHTQRIFVLNGKPAQEVGFMAAAKKKVPSARAIEVLIIFLCIDVFKNHGATRSKKY